MPLKKPRHSFRTEAITSLELGGEREIFIDDQKTAETFPLESERKIVVPVGGDGKSKLDRFACQKRA